MSSPRSRAVAWVATGVLGGAIVTGAVVSQLTAATAASPSPSPGQTQQYGYGPGMGAGMGMPMGGMRAMRGLGRVAHGELKVQTKTGTFQTVVVQNGKVTAVDATAKTVTVKSDDGFTATYKVDSNTRIRKDRAGAQLSDVKVGDTLHVAAVKASDGTLTAKMIGDGVMPGPGRGMHRGWDKDKDKDKDAPQPNATATPGTST